MIRSPLALGGALVLVLPLTVHAQTTSKVIIGGQGSCASTGFNNPGLLDDGATPGEAVYTFTLDTLNSELTLVVDNTSPVTSGDPNPVITDVYFNLPSAITGISLTSQSGSGGAAPSYSLATNKKADGFGFFSVELSNGGGVSGGISNPSADTLGVPAGSNVVSPVTFTMELTGNLSGLTAASIVGTFSTSAPNKPAVAVAKFQAGGPMGASGFIAEGYCMTPATMTTLGTGCGATLTSDMPLLNTIVNVTIDSDAAFAPGWAVASPPVSSSIPFQGCQIWLNLSSPIVFSQFMTDMNGDHTVGVMNPSYWNQPDHCGLEFNIQAVVFHKGGPLPIGSITNGIFLQLGV